MAAETVKTPLDRCKYCIDNKIGFVLQGGAGSGKTESLKELLIYIKSSIPSARVMCITHTNVAANEIASRTGMAYPVSTIHSFLNSLIKDYKINIHSVIGSLFTVPLMERGIKSDDISDSEFAKAEHEKYKTIWGKYASRLYQLEKSAVEKAVGKREYDTKPEEYNNILNEKITALNNKILSIVEEKDYSKIKYNETKFDDFRDLSYGHDGLLKIFHLIIQRYPLLSKMISDKFDYIFVDEYQDTNSDIICDLIQITKETSLVIGLFGDSMQAIYGDGVGNVDQYISDHSLELIQKPDNYRCAYEIIEAINPLRIDGLIQNVALKHNDDGNIESSESRHGKVEVLYSIFENKPNAYSALEDKIKYQNQIEKLINRAKQDYQSAKVLMLTNKAIAEKNHFLNLYKTFDDRYLDVGDRMEKYLSSIQVLDLCAICNSYIKREYNSLIQSIRSSGFVIHNANDKLRLATTIEKLTSDTEISLWDAIRYAAEQNLIKVSESCKNKVEQELAFVESINSDHFFEKFCSLYENGDNTYNKMKGKIELASDEVFDDWKSQLKRKQFVSTLFSNSIKFAEALRYYEYLEEETEFITMHKTKGSSIASVIVVMEEYYWNEYDFSSIYASCSPNTNRSINSKKLIYVACSRAQNELACIRIIKPEEENDFLNMFPFATKVEE